MWLPFTIVAVKQTKATFHYDLTKLYLCQVVSTNYYGPQKFPVLYCCMCIWFLKSSVLLQKIYIFKGWSAFLLPCFGVQWTSLDTVFFLFLIRGGLRFFLLPCFGAQWTWSNGHRLFLISKTATCKASPSLSDLSFESPYRVF